MRETTDDPWRLRDALAGDEGAWVGIVDEFHLNVWHWARRQGLTREEAEDVSQTVWYRLKDKGHAIDDPRRLPAWLATTTRREAQRVRGRRDRLDVVSVDDDEHDVALPDIGPGPDDAAEASELRHRLATAFVGLRQRCRELLTLCWQDRFSYAEIAEQLDIPVGSIGPTRQRCLDTLRLKAGLA